MKVVLIISEFPEMKAITDDWKNKSMPSNLKDE